MANPLAYHSWSPYAVGVGIGMLSWFAFASADHPIGVTTAPFRFHPRRIGELGSETDWLRKHFCGITT